MYKVSIIIPVYNQEQLIIKALDSIPRRDDIEVIVVDDCSTDRTLELVSNYRSDLNIKVFHLEENMGDGYARDIGFSNCTGEYIFGLDSDDELITDKWSEVVDKFLYNNYDIIRVSRIENTGMIGKYGCAFHTYFFNRKLLDKVKIQHVRRASDYYFDIDLNKLSNLSTIHSNIIAYKYNYPREGSQMWGYQHGK